MQSWTRCPLGQAFALHPLVDSVTTANILLTTYRTRLPDLDNLLR